MTGMTRDCCSGQRCGHCRHHAHEDTRWAVPALGVILALAAAGIIREHGHGALEAARIAGYAAFGLSAAAAVILIALRIRKQRRLARSAPVQAVITSARPGQLRGSGFQAIRQGRPALRALPRRRHDQADS